MTRNRILQLIRILFVISLLLYSANLAFAWFSFTAGFGGVESSTATVELAADAANSTGVQTVEIISGRDSAALQRPLDYDSLDLVFNDSSISDIDKQYQYNNIFSGWWNEYADDMSQHLIPAYNSLLTPGGFVFKKYAFINNSNVPVYFRIQKPAIEIVNGPCAGLKWHNAMLAWFMDTEYRDNPWNFDPLRDALMIDGGPNDNYFYYPKALKPGQGFSVMFASYGLGGANTNALQNQEFTFIVNSAELIQATNNSVYLDDSWRSVIDSGAVHFIPYTEK